MKIGERIKLIAFDIDGTLTKGYSWYRLNKAMGISSQEDNEMVQLLKASEANVFKVANRLKHYYYHFPNHNKKHMESVLFNNFEYNPQVKKTITSLSKKYLLAVVSGAPHLFVRYIAEQLKIPIWRSSHYVLFDKNGYNFVRIWVEGETLKLKPLFLESIGRQQGIGPNQMMFVGDSFGDQGAFDYATYSVLYLHRDGRMNTDDMLDKLKKEVKFKINNFDQLFDILNIDEE